MRPIRGVSLAVGFLFACSEPGVGPENPRSGIATVVHAQSAIGGADVVRSDGTLIFDATGTPFVDPDGQCQGVTSPSGVVTSRCQGRLPVGAVLPSRAVIWDFATTGLTCLGSTEWQQTVTPSGSATDYCIVRP